MGLIVLKSRDSFNCVVSLERRFKLVISGTYNGKFYICEVRGRFSIGSNFQIRFWAISSSSPEFQARAPSPQREPAAEKNSLAHSYSTNRSTAGSLARFESPAAAPPHR